MSNLDYFMKFLFPCIELPQGKNKLKQELECQRLKNFLGMISLTCPSVKFTENSQVLLTSGYPFVLSQGEILHEVPVHPYENCCFVYYAPMDL